MLDNVLDLYGGISFQVDMEIECIFWICESVLLLAIERSKSPGL